MPTRPMNVAFDNNHPETQDKTNNNKIKRELRFMRLKYA